MGLRGFQRSGVRRTRLPVGVGPKGPQNITRASETPRAKGRMPGSGRPGPDRPSRRLHRAEDGAVKSGTDALVWWPGYTDEDQADELEFAFEE